VVAATAGLIFSIITGSIICSIVSNIKGIQFFNIESSIYVYVLIMLGIALVTDMLAEGIVNTCNSVNYGYKRKKKKRD
jgi:high-affinity Fe2+/Pb2+ permease